MATGQRKGRKKQTCCAFGGGGQIRETMRDRAAAPSVARATGVRVTAPFCPTVEPSAALDLRGLPPCGVPELAAPVLAIGPCSAFGPLCGFGLLLAGIAAGVSAGGADGSGLPLFRVTELAAPVLAIGPCSAIRPWGPPPCGVLELAARVLAIGPCAAIGPCTLAAGRGADKGFRGHFHGRQRRHTGFEAFAAWSRMRATRPDWESYFAEGA